MNANAKWIKVGADIGTVSPKFRRTVNITGKVKKAEARVSAMGAYNFFVNGKKVGKNILSPGWTSYNMHLLYQTYDITDMLREGENTLGILCGKGWAMSEIGNSRNSCVYTDHISTVAEIRVEYADGNEAVILTDGQWQCYTSHIMDSEIYHGETVDMTSEIKYLGAAEVDTSPKSWPVPQESGAVIEHERFPVREIIHTPKGETVLDFGQNLSGYVEISVKGERGGRIVLSHAEVLDREGNFYTANMRRARNLNTYILSGDQDIFKPSFCFQGFRYVRLDEYPCEIIAEDFTAVAIYTDMKRTGYFECGNADINQLYSNIIWGQRGNFVDIPTDCPQRDERLGWTADAQVFCRTAAINYDVEKFFDKWLCDMALEQRDNGAVLRVTPFAEKRLGGKISAGWSDACVIVPWEIYRAYGDKNILEKYYPMMTKWIEYIHNFGDEEYLWIGGDHYGDWLAMDAGEGSYYGATQTDFVASAYFAYSTSLVIKAGRVLGKDTSYHEQLYKNIRSAFREAFMKDGLPVIYPKADAFSTKRPVKADTQTAMVIILHFGLCEENERPRLVQRLCELIEENGGRMTTGFIGTAYLMHVLSDNGRTDVAYSLLLQEKAPSWLFSVKHGATTIWEHWDGIKEDGSFWSDNMNSFNHYAYGSVFDWIFETVGGISICDGSVAYERVRIAPTPDKRLGYADCGIETRRGMLSVKWRYEGDRVRYDIEIPEGTTADICLSNETLTVGSGRYSYTV